MPPGTSETLLIFKNRSSQHLFPCVSKYVLGPTLHRIGFCSPLQLISHHINDIEALGDISALNREAIAKALSRNRSLYALVVIPMLLFSSPISEHQKM